MFGKWTKGIFSLTLSAVLLSGTALCSCPVAGGRLAGEAKKTVICIDPGHGGETEGAKYEYGGEMVMEKDINLAIALKLEEELQNYENVELVLTRTEDTTMEIQPRVQFAAEHGADYLISVHINACGNGDLSQKGCMVLSTVSHYQAPGAKLSDIHGASERLGLAIIERLQGLGLTLGTELGAEVNGIVKRPYSPEGNARTTSYYPDGSVADYYALIRFGVEQGLPAIIIEHAYLSNEAEYYTYLGQEESLDALARADAEGIADALGLVRKQGSAPAASIQSVPPVPMPEIFPQAVRKGAKNYRILRLTGSGQER